ncbi:hypothetical protein [Sphingomonas hengshuiensis]|uniref:Uncharacterized protein n=1 Tax=Sphingomonas hengshuiensis TaxID=1609977 RepID=A0A7U4LE09_9SPHN|nr:hypothetical protein [Sphingomonas hengshuiensis]AJP71034.1 hypothetical protein TS85_03165 [Sphingomonas hengshuiensis]
MPTIAERVNAHITQARPSALCDDCIAKELHLSRRQQSARVTGALETTSDFERVEGLCALPREQESDSSDMTNRRYGDNLDVLRTHIAGVSVDPNMVRDLGRMKERDKRPMACQ